ncbi:MAG TPA: sulfatase-like hydrolase/transferase, partial [Leptospiraceae bacterium]|nr:sulfatase-like hydrolase/transferase [Leptospiraceae bacterium]
MSKYRSNLFAFLKKLKRPFFFSLFLQISSVLLNTSFSLMGFDISETVRTYFNFQFAFVFLSASVKIFFIYFIFFTFLQLLFERFFEKYRLPGFSSYLLFSFFVFVFFIESVGRYPQMYSDFFYGKHSYLKFLLHFTTDYISPDIVRIFVIMILALPAVIQMILSLKSPDFSNVSLSVFSVFLVYLHYEGYSVIILSCFFAYILMQGFSFQTSFRNALTAVLLSFFIIGCVYYSLNLHSAPSERNSDYSLILISADSLRKDRIGLKRNGESITPNIDRFAKEAFQFADHHTTVPRTFASWADLLTGQYSMRHKVRDMFPSPSEAANIGSAEFPVIGQKLAERGFATAVFSSFAGDIFPRADFGFQTVHTADFNARILVVQKALEAQVFLLPIISGTVPGGEYFEEIRAFASRGDGAQYERPIKKFIQRNSGRPFFLTVFSSVTHFPYSPPYPY